MAKKNSGPGEAIKGAVEDAKGKAKEAVGDVAGRDDVAREGQAQQDKADAQRDAAKKEAEAEAARGSRTAPKVPPIANWRRWARPMPGGLIVGLINRWPPW